MSAILYILHSRSDLSLFPGTPVCLSGNYKQFLFSGKWHHSRNNSYVYCSGCGRTCLPGHCTVARQTGIYRKICVCFGDFLYSAVLWHFSGIAGSLVFFPASIHPPAYRNQCFIVPRRLSVHTDCDSISAFRLSAFCNCIDFALLLLYKITRQMIYQYLLVRVFLIAGKFNHLL